MRRQTFLFVAVALPVATMFAAAQSSSARPARAAAISQSTVPTAAPGSLGIELTSIDRGADACTDFYQLACGSWMAANPIPPDRQRWGRFNQLQDRNFTILRRILETPGGGGDQRKAGDYYAACMDEDGIEAKGLRPLAADLARITAITRKE